MSGRGVRVAFLCEDEAHWRFARNVFLNLGYHTRELRRVDKSPSARGAAEQRVRQRFPDEVRAHRRRASSQNVALVVVIDADKQDVEYRHQQLSNALSESGIDKRGPGEAVIVCVPKRNIETWVAYLLGRRPINEDDDYKNVLRGADYGPPAARFVEIHRDRAHRPADLLPSISRAFTELARLPD
jgi:hypothetical protein